MNILTKKSADLDEREKLFKLIQYSIHFIQAVRGNAGSKDEIDALAVLQTSRQALRFGKCVDAFNSSISHLSIQDPTFRAALVLSRISESLYLLCDHLLWVSKLGLLKVDQSKFANLANLYLLYAQLLMLAKNIYQMHVILKSRYYTIDCYTERISLAEHVKHFVHFNKALTVDMLGNVCEVMLCLDRLDRIHLGPFKRALLGIIGSALPFFRYRNNILF